VADRAERSLEIVAPMKVIRSVIMPANEDPVKVSVVPSTPPMFLRAMMDRQEVNAGGSATVVRSSARIFVPWKAEPEMAPSFVVVVALNVVAFLSGGFLIK